ncbi:FAD-dependent oxidoreductase [Ralstonia sp. 22086]|uniref:FAD-dependent oxidoreductase n=1 Tax=Ralstonia sp. 22086 TaxID=3453870 RepID=UPI003F8495BA
MTSPAQKILVIGGGFSGMAAAIQCAKVGMQVDLVEIDPHWRAYGAGISIGGPTLRALKTIGVLDAFRERGYCGDGVNLFTASGQALGQLPTPRVAGPDVPGGGAIMRPVLADILARATVAAGINVRLGCTFSTIEQRADGVVVAFTDGAQGTYDLVIGADGLYSKVREAVFPDAPKPQYCGQGVWRAVVPRPADITCATMWLGQKVKTGVNPVSDGEMYLFVTEDRPTNDYVDPQHWPHMLSDLLAPFSAPLMQTIRGQISAQSLINYRPLERLLMPRPWFSGRVVLIGDTVHATTPHMAAGAGIGLEDAIVLAEELHRAATLDAALQAFQNRRWDRCRMVVENSGRLGEIEIAGGDKAEHASIMRDTLMSLAQDI